ncbi:MAG TPA: hypothetical protein VGG39_03090 [Polyangiaceae bacterium]
MRRSARALAVLIAAEGCARSPHAAPAAVVDAASPEAAVEAVSAPPEPPAPATPLPLPPEVTAKLATRRRAMCRCVASAVDPVAPGSGPYGVIDFDVVVPADGGATGVTMKRATVEYPPGAEWCLRAIVGATRFGAQPADLGGPYQMRFDGHECEPRAKKP